MLKLAQVGIPNWVTNLISNWYTKLHVAVRWNGCMSVNFKVNSGVRQGSILSPALFHLYINRLILDLRVCSSGCHVNNYFIGCIFHADDILLLYVSVGGLQELLSVCNQSVSYLSLKFNCTKSFCITCGQTYDTPISDMKLGNNIGVRQSSI